MHMLSFDWLLATTTIAMLTSDFVRMRCWPFSMEIFEADKDGYLLGLAGLFPVKTILLIKPALKEINCKI